MYYIYLHSTKDNNQPFYIGKGKSRRAYSKRSRSLYWRNIVKKHGYIITFIEKDLNEKEANEREKYWISFYGRKDIGTGCLVNFTNGGEGSSGRPMSDRCKAILRAVNTGKPTSQLQKDIVGIRYKGKFGKDHNRSKSVKCSNGRIYSSMSEAARELNISNSSVSWSIKYHKPIYGLYFEINI